jgi:hypothetical protein
MAQSRVPAGHSRRTGPTGMNEAPHLSVTGQIPSCDVLLRPDTIQCWDAKVWGDGAQIPEMCVL